MTTTLLFHGTSSTRLKQILAENCLRRQGPGGPPNPKVSFTPARQVAEYWGCMSALGDRDRCNRNRVPDGATAVPVFLVFDAEVIAGRYKLVPYSDPFWGEGECDWEYELYSRRSIKPLDRVLLAVEPVGPKRLDDYQSY